MILTITEISQENHVSRNSGKIKHHAAMPNHAVNLGPITHHADYLGPITRHGKPFSHPVNSLYQTKKRAITGTYGPEHKRLTP